jgi:hypothetical protein
MVETKTRRVWVMLALRPALARFALGEILNLWILIVLARREGMSLRALYNV